MITVSSNIGQVAARLTAKLKEFQGGIKDKVIRTVATDQLGAVRKRIYNDGVKADGSPIGQYSAPYLRFRQRKPFNNTDSPKIIFSLTRRMQGDFHIIPTEKGYGLGFSEGSFLPTKPKAIRKPRKKKPKAPKPYTHSQLVEWLEDRFGKVWSLTSGEKQNIKPVAERAVKEELVRLNLQ